LIPVITKTFPKEQLKELLWGEVVGLEVIENEITDTSRWSIHYYLVFQELNSGKIYGTTYSRGATESQDEQPFEYAADEITCTELEAVEVIKTEYRPKSDV